MVKPVSRERLRIAIERARKFTAEQIRRIGDEVRQESRSHICARIRGSLRLVPIGEIAYFLAEDKYVVVHHDGGEVLIEESLKTLEDEFHGRFVRIHRNCLVAVDRITALERGGEGIAADHADGQRGLLRSEGPVGPLHVTGEIEQEGHLGLGFRKLRERSPRSAQRPEQYQRRQAPDERCQNCHLAFT